MRFIDCTANLDGNAELSKYEASRQLVQDVWHYILDSPWLQNHYLSGLLRYHVALKQSIQAAEPSHDSVYSYFQDHFPDIKVVPNQSKGSSWPSSEENAIRIPESIFAQYSIGATVTVSSTMSTLIRTLIWPCYRSLPLNSATYFS